jgi:transcriptional regulator with XRE-family HTH domain
VKEPRLPEAVAAEIRAELARRRLSARRAAARLGWTQAYLSRRLNGDVPFDVKDIEALAGLLGVSPQRFFRSYASDDDPEDQLRALADAWQRRSATVKRTA